MIQAGPITDFAAGGVHFTFDREGNKLNIKAYIPPYETSSRADMTPSQYMHYTNNWVRDLFAQLTVELQRTGLHVQALPKEEGIVAGLSTDCLTEQQHMQMACKLVQKTHAITGAQAMQYGLPGNVLLNVVTAKQPPSVQIQALGIMHKSQDERAANDLQMRAYRHAYKIGQRIQDRIEPQFAKRFSKQSDGMGSLLWELNDPHDLTVFAHSINGAVMDYVLEQKIKSQSMGKA